MKFPERLKKARNLGPLPFGPLPFGPLPFGPPPFGPPPFGPPPFGPPPFGPPPFGPPTLRAPNPSGPTFGLFLGSGPTPPGTHTFGRSWPHLAKPHLAKMRSGQNRSSKIGQMWYWPNAVTALRAPLQKRKMAKCGQIQTIKKIKKQDKNPTINFKHLIPIFRPKSVWPKQVWPKSVSTVNESPNVDIVCCRVWRFSPNCREWD